MDSSQYADLLKRELVEFKKIIGAFSVVIWKIKCNPELGLELEQECRKLFSELDKYSSIFYHATYNWAKIDRATSFVAKHIFLEVQLIKKDIDFYTDFKSFGEHCMDCVRRTDTIERDFKFLKRGIKEALEH
jgi:hypothetical protein